MNRLSLEKERNHTLTQVIRTWGEKKYEEKGKHRTNFPRERRYLYAIYLRPNP